MTDSQKSMAKTFNANTKVQKQYSVGVAPPSDGKVETWVQSTIQAPMPMRIELRRLDTLLFDVGFGAKATEGQKANLKKALDVYCAKLVGEDKIKSCDAPKPYPREPKAGKSTCRFCHQGCGGNYPVDGGSIVVD